MFERSISTRLEAWARKTDRKPLVIRGARQVGKTVAVRMFGARFERFIELNLENTEDADQFRRGLSPADLWQSISLGHEGADVPRDETLLFIDEIQACPEAIGSLRFFREEMPDLMVIAAGSLLEAVLSRERISFPVGRIEFEVMRPLSFREFLTATGRDDLLAVLHRIPVQEFAHARLLAAFHRYTLVGGMPEVVDTYARTADIAALAGILDDLMIGYLDDVARYARNDALRSVIRHCIEQAPLEAGHRIKLEGFGHSRYRSREVGEAMKSLERAMLLTLVRPTTSTRSPLKPDHRKRPRLQFLDTGLVNHVAGLSGQYFAHRDLHAIHRGIVAEHVVGQELLAKSSRTLPGLLFWVREKSQSSAEVDYLVQHGVDPVPVEVKAGASGTLRSLHQFMDRSGLRWAVRLWSGGLQVEDARTVAGSSYRLLSMPYYLAGWMDEYIDWAMSA